jgi:hypothetical protein
MKTTLIYIAILIVLAGFVIADRYFLTDTLEEETNKALSE